MSARRWRGVILAAGRGRRLRPLSDRVPKCLVSLGGRALLDWQLDAMHAARIHEIAVVRGYRARQVRRPDVVAFANPDWRRSAMVTSLVAARAWLRAGPCVVSYGDIVYHPRALEALIRVRADVAIVYDVAWRALWTARFARPESDAESLRVECGRVTAIGDRIRNLRDADGQYIGLVRFTPRGWRRTEGVLARLQGAALRALEMTHLLARLVEDGVRVGAVPIRGCWCEVDAPGDVALYEARLASAKPWSHDWRAAAR
jgi:choline kinase